MTGIHFVINDKGRKVAVQIDLDRYGEMWEDFYDHLVTEERKNDKRIPFNDVRKRLVKAGKLRA